MKKVILNRLKQIDWNKTQLVKWVSKDFFVIVLTNGEQREGSFSGMVVASNTESDRVGKYQTTWNKDAFAPTDEKVMLKNDEDESDGK